MGFWRVKLGTHSIETTSGHMRLYFELSHRERSMVVLLLLLSFLCGALVHHRIAAISLEQLCILYVCVYRVTMTYRMDTELDARLYTVRGLRATIVRE